jgi:hypothetical protein
MFVGGGGGVEGERKNLLRRMQTGVACECLQAGTGVCVLLECALIEFASSGVKNRLPDSILYNNPIRQISSHRRKAQNTIRSNRRAGALTNSK